MRKLSKIFRVAMVVAAIFLTAVAASSALAQQIITVNTTLDGAAAPWSAGEPGT